MNEQQKTESTEETKESAPPEEVQKSKPTKEAERSDLDPQRNLTLIVYVLQGLSFFFGLTALAGIIINYLKFDLVRGTWLESHFTWQIRTFWYGLLWFMVGLILMVFGIGYLIWLATYIWIIYRIVKGGLNYNESKPMSVG